MSESDIQAPSGHIQQNARKPALNRDSGNHKGKGKGKGGGKGKPSGGAKLRGMERDSPEVRVSKTLSWLLRHGAANEGLPIRKDGFIKVDDVLNHPKLKAVSLGLNGLQDIVKADSKQRYSLIYEAEGEGASAAVPADESNEGTWWIKANQGHSIKTVELELKPIVTAADIPSGVAVHGTNGKAWNSISTQGLSKMKRNHIHLAQGIAGQNVLSGMRQGSQILIFIDVQKALDAGIKFFLSDNGVVLSEGDENGILKPEFFSRVENSKREPLEGWEGSGPIAANTVDPETKGNTTGEGYKTPQTEAPPALDTLNISE